MVYCVEDDASIRDLMIYTLNASGYEAEGFNNGVPFFEALNERKPDLIMLDIMLPGDDGITILKKLRNQSATADIPIIMASAKGMEYDKVIGLDLGADDYMSKPFGMMEMISRIRAVLRRTQPKEKNMHICVGQLTLDLSEHTVMACGTRINLTLKEFELLRIFMENLGKVYSRDMLFSHVWGADYIGETRTVDVHIGTLRTKLGACGDYIETVRGIGYRMEGKI